MSAKNDLPTPEMLLVEAKGTVERNAPIDLYDYADVIGQLRAKHFSFGKIAEWLGEKLGRPINKGVVYRIYDGWKFEQEKLEDLREEYDGPPPDEHDEINMEIRRLADRILDYAEDAASNKAMPSHIAEEAIIQAAWDINQRRNDERAAEEADGVNGEKKEGEKS